MKTTKDTRIAVLIDADNVPSANIKSMLEEIAKYGTPTFKRIYGDWTKPNLAGWKSLLLEMQLHLYNSIVTQPEKIRPTLP